LSGESGVDFDFFETKTINHLRTDITETITDVVERMAKEMMNTTLAWHLLSRVPQTEGAKIGNAVRALQVGKTISGPLI
jgi:hypothetical protein